MAKQGIPASGRDDASFKNWGALVTDRTSDPFLDSLRATPRNDFAVLPSAALPRIPELFPNRAAPAAPAPLQPEPAPAPAALDHVFLDDSAPAADGLDHEAKVRPLAELCAHRGAQTPLVVGIFGPAGCGKSDALRRLARQAEILGGEGLVSLRVDAASLRGDASEALADAVHAGLVGKSRGALAQAAADAVGDPHRSARELADHLDEGRLALETQTAALRDIAAKRDRLAETLLSDAGPSPLDAYARANRGKIEARLRRFGFVGGDPMANYRELVRDLSHRGVGLSAFLHATWAFAGQTRLLVWAALSAALALGLGYGLSNKALWLDPLRQAGPMFSPAAAWILDHEFTLALLRPVLFGLAGFLVLLNFWRAFRFLRPLQVGVRLLKSEMATRRADLDAAYARQERRVQDGAREVEAREKAFRQADQRAQEAPSAQAPVNLRSEPAPAAKAAGFFAALEAALAETGPVKRLLVAVDHIDMLAPERAAEWLLAIRNALVRRGFVVAIAADGARLDHRVLDGLIDAPFQLAPHGLAPNRAAQITAEWLGQRVVSRRGEPAPAIASGLDRPLTVAEAALLSELAPLAGTPRRVKRLVNLYRLARGPQPQCDAALALILALQQGGLEAELEAMRAALAGKAPEAEFDPGFGNLRLVEWVAQVKQANNGRLSVGQVRQGLTLAEIYSL